MEIFKTILAYLLALTLSPIFSGFSNFIFFPIFAIPFFQKKIPSIIGTILIGITGGICAIWFGTKILFWFGIKPGNLMLLVISLAFLQNNIYRIKTRTNKPFEYRYFGGTFWGILIASLIFVWGFEISQIKMLLIISGVLILLYSFITTNGNVQFWKLVEEHPYEAYLLITNSDAWCIIDSNTDKEKMTKDYKWDGPFIYHHPKLGKKVELYGKVGEYEKYQEMFIEMFKQ